MQKRFIPLVPPTLVSIMEDAVGNLWVATQKGVIIIDAQKKCIQEVWINQMGLSNDFVQSFTKLNDKIVVHKWWF